MVHIRQFQFTGQDAINIEIRIGKEIIEFRQIYLVKLQIKRVDLVLCKFSVYRNKLLITCKNQVIDLYIGGIQDDEIIFRDMPFLTGDQYVHFVYLNLDTPIFS